MYEVIPVLIGVVVAGACALVGGRRAMFAGVGACAVGGALVAGIAGELAESPAYALLDGGIAVVTFVLVMVAVRALRRRAVAEREGA